MKRILAYAGILALAVIMSADLSFAGMRGPQHQKGIRRCPAERAGAASYANKADTKRALQHRAENDYIELENVAAQQKE